MNTKDLFYKTKLCENGAPSVLYNECTKTFIFNEKCMKKCAENEDSEPELFVDETQFRKHAKHLFYGDFYVYGRLWIKTMKSVLLGTKILNLPAVKAAKPEEPADAKPKRIKPSDLPTYGNKYGPYRESQQKICKEVHERMLLNFLKPYVANKRAQLTDICTDACKKIHSTKNEIRNGVKENRKAVVEFFRDEKQMHLRLGTVALGGLVGILASQSKGTPTRLIYIGLGCLAAGSLCFPEQADMCFKNICYYTAKTVICFYNWDRGTNFALREKLPCKIEVDGKKKDDKKAQYKPNVCTPKK